MKPLALSYVALSALLVAIAAHAEPDNAWVARMDGFAALLADIVSTSEAARDPNGSADAARDERVRVDGRALSALAGDLPRMATAGDAGDVDPTVLLLARELDRAVDDMTHARGDALRSDAAFVAATCFGCHTRNARGAPVPRTRLAAVDRALPAWARGDALAATRRFAEARAAYDAAVSDEAFAEQEPLLWERAVRRDLVVAVRVQRDPAAALATIERVLGTPSASALWPAAADWQRSARAWQRAAKPATVDLYAHAEALMNEAAAMAHTPGDDGAFIVYLRATADLHELLSRGRLSPPRRAQVLAWLGEAYATLRDVDVWSLYLLYDEACIAALPHSELALTCYERLAQGTAVEERGNGGAPLEPESAAQLARLRALATP